MSTPKIHVLLLPLALGALLACGQAESTADESFLPERGTIEADRDSHDFGTVYEMSSRSTTFELVAVGPGDVMVNDLVRSCGCTEGELFVRAEDGTRTRAEQRHPYPPGTRFDLVARLNTAGKSGEQNQKVRLLLDGHEEMPSFELLAVIEPFVVFTPALLDVETFSTLTGATATTRAKVASGEPFTLSTTESEGLELTMAPIGPTVDGAASEWEITAQVQAGAPPGIFSEKLLLETSIENVYADANADDTHPPHSRELWIRGIVEGALRARPERITFGNLLPGVGITRRVAVDNLDPNFESVPVVVHIDEGRGPGAPADFVGATSVTSEVRADGRGWDFEVTLLDVPRRGSVEGRLRVEIGHPTQNEVVIPFKAFVREAQPSPTPSQASVGG